MKPSHTATPAEKQFMALTGSASTLDIGPHSASLVAELARLIGTDTPISQIILAATIADSLAHEHSDSDEGGAPDGWSWLSRQEIEALLWLRERRNQLVHYQGRSHSITDLGALALDADAALSALLPLLEEREIIR